VEAGYRVLVADEPADEQAACWRCGAAAPAGARFCPTCGHALLGDGQREDYEPGVPRLFGVLSPLTTLVFGCMLLLGAIVAFAAASPIAAIVLLALAGAVFVLSYGAAERERSSAASRRLLRATQAVRGWTSFTTSSAGAWSRAGRQIWRLRAELRRLRRERRDAQLTLGDAAYRGDEAAVALLRERMRHLDGEIESREAARTAALSRARRRVADERTAAHHTEVIPPNR
jgi:ribosomal protein L40E